MPYSAKKNNREWILDQLGRICVNCATTENLEIDHIDCMTRLSRVDTHYESRIAATKALPDLQVLCNTCHRAKSRKDRALKAGQREHWEHGTITGYFYAKCKCDLCMDAMRSYGRELYARRKAKLGRQSIT